MGSLSKFLSVHLVIFTFIYLGTIEFPAAQELKKGSFTGASGHVTKGSVSIVKSGNGYKLVLGGNFWHDGAPDPYIAIGSNTQLKGGVGLLKALPKNQVVEGKQEVNLPSGIAPASVKQVQIWCKRYGVSLGHATMR